MHACSIRTYECIRERVALAHSAHTHEVEAIVKFAIARAQSSRSTSSLASYPGVRGEGRRKRTPGAHCLRMRLIKSPFYDDDVFVWVRFCS